MILTKPKSLSAGPSDGTGEGVAHSKRWYVALVRMHHEKKVAERLDKMGIENFVPVQQEIHQWSDRRKVVESVLLPMMVFVHVNPKERKEVLGFSTVSRYMVMRGESLSLIHISPHYRSTKTAKYKEQGTYRNLCHHKAFTYSITRH